MDYAAIITMAVGAVAAAFGWFAGFYCARSRCLRRASPDLSGFVRQWFQIKASRRRVAFSRWRQMTGK